MSRHLQTLDTMIAKNASSQTPWWALVALLAFGLTACSSSDPAPADDAGGDDESEEVDPEAEEGEDEVSNGIGEPDELVDVLFFTGSLKAVDPTRPDRVFDLADGVFPTALIQEGEFSAADGAVRNIRDRGVVYATDFELRFVDSLAIAERSPREVPLASLPSPPATLTVSHDFASPNNTHIIVELQDGTSRAVSFLGNEAPFPGQHLADIVDPQDGSLRGWLATDGQLVNRVDLNLNATLLLDLNDPFSTVELLGTTGEGEIYFFENDGNTRKVLQFKPDNPNTLFSFSATVENTESFDTTVDESALFILRHRLDTQIAVHRVSGEFENEFFVDDVDNEPSGFDDTRILAAGDRLVLMYGANFTRLATVGKDGSDFILVDSGFFGSAQTSGPSVVYNRGSSAQAVTFRADDLTNATLEVFDLARWIGGTITDLHTGGDVHEHFFLADGVSLAGATPGGATLRAVDGADPTQLGLDLGVIPDDVLDAFFFGSSSSGAGSVLGQGNVLSANDIFLVNPLEPNSLVRVTDTAGVSEGFVGDN